MPVGVVQEFVDRQEDGEQHRTEVDSTPGVGVEVTVYPFKPVHGHVDERQEYNSLNKVHYKQGYLDSEPDGVFHLALEVGDLCCNHHTKLLFFFGELLAIANNSILQLQNVNDENGRNEEDEHESDLLPSLDAVLGSHLFVRPLKLGRHFFV